MENPVSYARHHKFVMGALVIIVILVTAIGARFIGREKPTEQQRNLSKIKLLDVKNFLKSKSIITANGTVESLEQADLRSQASGQVTSVLVKIGQKVKRGQILVSLQQSDAAAGLAQAKAALKSQEARLDEMKKGARTEQIQVAETALNVAKQTLIDTQRTQDALVANAYSSLLNTGLALVPNAYNVSKATLALSGSYLMKNEGVYTVKFPSGGEKPPFSVFGPESDSGWVIRGTALPIGKSGLYFTVSTDGDIYPNDSWTLAIPNTQSPLYAAVKNGYDTALQARDAAVNGATNAVAVAQTQYDLVVAGATSDQIKAQQAAVEQARASVAAMSAQLEKTVIRSPMNGAVAGISVKYGELVSPGSLIAKVVSSGGLQVKTFISESDLLYVKEGASATINETIKGKVLHVAPSIDPSTKNIEATVMVEDYAKSGLVVGQSAVLKIYTEQKGGTIYLLPIQSVQVATDGAGVFTLDSSSTLELIPVKLGSVSGEFVEVTEGLKDDMRIVSAVYDLKPGQKVIAE